MSVRTLVFLPCLIGAFAVAPLPCVANTSMTRFRDLNCTDYAIAGVGGIGSPPSQGGGHGSLHRSGVSGTVTLAPLHCTGTGSISNFPRKD